MSNDYLIGFKRSFQPERKTAVKVYQEIIRRNPKFLQNQVPANLSSKQKQYFGECEGDFLNDEIMVNMGQIQFSNLAQELLFDKQPDIVIPTKPKAIVTHVENATTKTRENKVYQNKIDQSVKHETSKHTVKTKVKEDENSWQL